MVETGQLQWILFWIAFLYPWGQKGSTTFWVVWIGSVIFL